MYVYVYGCVHGKSLQSCLTLYHPMDYSLPGFSVHGIHQARTLEWVAMPSSKGSSWPRHGTCVSYVSCIGRQVLYHECHLGSPCIWALNLSQRWRSSITVSKNKTGSWLWLRSWTPYCQIQKKVGKTTRPLRYDLNKSLMIIQWKWQINSRD